MSMAKLTILLLLPFAVRGFWEFLKWAKKIDDEYNLDV